MATAIVWILVMVVDVGVIAMVFMEMQKMMIILMMMTTVITVMAPVMFVLLWL